MLPPLPPSPPSGPPLGTNISRRNDSAPEPPVPAVTRITARSMNATDHSVSKEKFVAHEKGTVRAPDKEINSMRKTSIERESPGGFHHTDGFSPGVARRDFGIR